MLDIFNSDAFGMVSLTDAINKAEYVPRKIQSMGLFDEVPVATTKVALEEKDGYLALLPTSERGGPATQKEKLKRKLRALEVPHIALESTIQASEVQDVRVFGSDSNLAGVQATVNMHLEDFSDSFAATLEWHMLGAIKGVVYDADGTTVIHNMHTEFEVAANADIDFNWATTTPGYIRTKFHEIHRVLEDNMGGIGIPQVHAFAGKDWFDSFVSHDEVSVAYERQGSAPNVGEFLRQRLARRQAIYAGIVVEEYRGNVSGKSFIEDDEAHFFPVGVPRLFRTYYAPGDFMETTNTLGLPMYAKSAPDRDFNRYVTLHAQTNPLCVCTRPGALQKGTMS